MPRGTPPKRPALYAEETLIRAILSGAYPPGSSLPPNANWPSEWA